MINSVAQEITKMIGIPQTSIAYREIDVIYHMEILVTHREPLAPLFIHIRDDQQRVEIL